MNTAKPPEAKTSQRMVKLKRIDDDLYSELIQQTQAINPYSGTVNFLRGADPQGVNFNLIEYYSRLRLLFGESSRFYDSWKGAFAFVFQMDVINGDAQQKYLLLATNLRGAFELRFYRWVDGIDSDDLKRYFEPFEQELSNRDMKHIDLWLHGFLKGANQLIKHTKIPNFYKILASDLVAFGYLEGKPFMHHYKDRDIFERESAKMKAKIESYTAVKWEAPLVDDWLEIALPS